MGRGAEREIVQNAIFRGKRHDNKILKVKILLSINFVVMAQALNFGVQPIPRVAPRVAPRIGFSHKLGRESHSENCSENAPEFRELLRE